MKEIYIEEVNFEDYKLNGTLKVQLSRVETGYSLKNLKTQFPTARIDLYVGMYKIPDNFINETVIEQLAIAYFMGLDAGSFNRRMINDEEDD